MFDTFYARILLPCDGFDIVDNPKYDLHYFLVSAKGRRFVSPIIDRELRRTGYSNRIKHNKNTGMGKFDIKIESKPFDENKVEWMNLKMLYPKHFA